MHARLIMHDDTGSIMNIMRMRTPECSVIWLIEHIGLIPDGYPIEIEYVREHMKMERSMSNQC